MFRKKACVILMAGVLAASIPYTVSAKKTAVKKVEYVALGDSLAAGQTPDSYLDYGYPDYLADYFTDNKYKLADFDNFSVPGYTSDRLKKDIKNSTKIRKEIKSSTHITIDIGANDLLNKLKTDPYNAPAAITEVRKNLDYILKTIDKLNPKVKVYVMGYYNPFPYSPKEQQDVLKHLLESLNAEISASAKKNGDKFVPTASVIGKKYKTYLPNKDDIHLSKSGYKALAKEFWKSISKK